MSSGAPASSGLSGPEQGSWAMPEPRRSPLLDRRLRHGTAIQSFAFDERRARMYALQVMEGGIQLPGEPGPLSHSERQWRGDLCMNALSMSGEPLGHMYLKGFGHGGTLGVEPRRHGRPALWTEGDANPSSGYGRGLARFRFRPGMVLEHHDRELETFRPRPGSTKNQVALDPYARRLLLRYRHAGAYRFALYDLARFRAGSFQALTDFVQPMPEGHLYHQGMAVYGTYAYQLTCSERGPSAEPLLTCVHLGTGRIVQRVRPEPAADSGLFEPEGLAVLQHPAPRLCVGFASGEQGVRLYSVYTTDLRRSPEVLGFGFEAR
ncbi:hypothetical protein GCM10009863_28220 [Streptomyces axinellae]|uniref:P68 RBP/TagC-like beta-propeller domain-containing protein n=1 Tax=Streptomyces axinellae TaxID=552788 RepID=A0ABN3Q5S5_9ACTN